jgi:hypothetical protein
MAHQLVESSVSVAFDSRWRRVAEQLQSVEHLMSEPVHRVVTARLSDLTFLRTNPLLCKRSLRFNETDPTNVGIDTSTVTVSFEDVDCTGQDITTALGGYMTAASPNGWTYTVNSEGKITVAVSNVYSNMALATLEPTADSAVVTENEFDARMINSIAYEMGFELDKILQVAATGGGINGGVVQVPAFIEPSFAFRTRGEETVFIKLIVDAREIGSLIIAQRPAPPHCFLGRLTMMTQHLGTSYNFSLPWMGNLDNATVDRFRIEFWMASRDGFRPYNMRGQDYSGLIQLISRERRGAFQQS